MAKSVPKGSTAVMARRTEPPDSLEYFPTPPWATRALFEHVIPQLGPPENRHICSAWDPACGEGHMAEAISEYVALVKATDIFDYGFRPVGIYPMCDAKAGWDFLDASTSISPAPDWIICNPPFSVAVDFTLRAFDLASVGVAMLVRTQWIEGKGRYERLFRDTPPSLFAPFVERVSMVKGRWDPDASTATSYAWFVWVKAARPAGGGFPTFLIPPCKRELSRPDDRAQFAAWNLAPQGTTPLLDHGNDFARPVAL